GRFYGATGSVAVRVRGTDWGTAGYRPAVANVFVVTTVTVTNRCCPAGQVAVHDAAAKLEPLLAAQLHWREAGADTPVRSAGGGGWTRAGGAVGRNRVRAVLRARPRAVGQLDCRIEQAREVHGAAEYQQQQRKDEDELDERASALAPLEDEGAPIRRA